MVKLKIENRYYRIHPIYDLYGADEKGNIVNIKRKVPMKGSKHNRGYLSCMIGRSNDKNRKNYLVHRFVWECFNGIIPDNMVIDHINDKRDDNRLSNLQLITPQENNKKAAKNRDYSFTANNFKKVRRVKAIDVETNEITCFSSVYATEKNLGIGRGVITKVCQRVVYHKTGISKIDGRRYRFEFID